MMMIVVGDLDVCDDDDDDDDHCYRSRYVS